MNTTLFKNAAQPENIPTYDGSNQSTHPSVLFFQDGLFGYPYWMAMTPYPYNNDGFEDPSILVSENGRDWFAPEGVQNPLTPAPKPGHNCDTELIYDEASGELRIYYVEADDVKQSWVKLMRTTDGSHWSKPEIVIHDPEMKFSILSPAIVRMDDGLYHMWCVDTGNTGYVCQENRIRERTSADGIHWSEPVTADDFLVPGYQPWHMTIQYEKETGTLHAFYPAYPNGGNCDDCLLLYSYKKPGSPWSTFSEPVLLPGTESWDDFCIYRTSVLLDSENDRIRMWYGGKKKSDKSWGIGYTETPKSAFLKAAQSE